MANCRDKHRLGGSASQPRRWRKSVRRADVAALMIDALTDDAAVRRAITVRR